MRPVILSVVICSILCGGCGILSSLPDLLALTQVLSSGGWGSFTSFEQGQMVGRVIGGPGSGLCCGGSLGLIVGFAVRAMSGKPAA